jgi:regulator of sigma E protease
MSISLLAALIFVVVFAGVVLTHEFGHFLVGRLFKVEIDEFGVGLPPRMLTLFHWKGTAFTLNWLPLGGFNRFKGENDPTVSGGLAASSPWVRLAVLLAGPSMNLVAGVLVYSLLFIQIGLPDFNSVKVYDVTPNSPAQQAGLKTDDIILSAAGQPISNDTQLRSVIQAHLDQPMQLTVKRGDQTLQVTATPLSSRSATEGALGILPGAPFVPAKSWFATLPLSTQTTYEMVHQILALPAQMIRGTLPAGEGRFVGLKGIFDFFQQAVKSDVQSREAPPAAPSASSSPLTPEGPTHLTLSLIATLTITLGVFNLLPFPALDGGRILFVLPELITGKRVPPEFENVVHAVGFTILLVFMLYVNVMDFVNPININLP